MYLPNKKVSSSLSFDFHFFKASTHVILSPTNAATVPSCQPKKESDEILETVGNPLFFVVAWTVTRITPSSVGDKGADCIKKLPA